jgi:riboflavin kinase/FMN adenylyltransferase
MTIAAIGNFDGVHRGHLFLIWRTTELARATGVQAAAVVFDPHPRRFFRPADPPFLITSAAMRERLLVEAGVDRVITLKFDAGLAALTPEEFVRERLKVALGLSGVVTGRDFRFGAGRSGDATSLGAICEANGIKAHIVEPLAEAGRADKIGSTAIREAIAMGAVDRAAAMLGRPWRVEGRVEEGRRLGRTLGFPTANLMLGDLVEPRRGVYVVECLVDGRRFGGVANFGRKPTVGAPHPLLEAHLFDFDGDLYGKTLGVDFVAFIRDEMKFDGLDALRAAIAADSLKAREILARRPGGV